MYLSSSKNYPALIEILRKEVPRDVGILLQILRFALHSLNPDRYREGSMITSDQKAIRTVPMVFTPRSAIYFFLSLLET